MELRTYQQRSLDCLYNWWMQHPGNNEIPLLVLPTGGGKSHVIAELTRLLFDTWPDDKPRTVVLVPSKELAEQNAEKLRGYLPSHISLGYYSASLGRKMPDADVIVATIGSIYKSAHVIGNIKCVIVDEAHLINPDGAEAGRYRKFLTELGRYCSFRVVGTTATPFRGNGVWLTDGVDPLFTGVASTVTVKELLDDGYLAPLVRPSDISTRIDVAGIKTTSGDYNIAELGERIEKYLASAADDACALAADRKKWLAFAATVANAQHLVALLNERGIKSALVCGATPKPERERLIADFRAGRLRCLTTVLALATGFDVPDVDCILWLRPTISPVLYVQGSGRGLRIAEGKENCIAEGQRVLTNVGLVPIERVTKAMLLWDGIDFVSHDGVIYKGEQYVITYAGITATPDHQVWTGEGWKTLSECAKQGIPIAIGGYGWEAIREADGHFRGGFDNQWAKIFTGLLCGLRRYWSAVRRKFKESVSRVSELRTSEGCSDMACEEMRGCAPTMHKPEPQEIQRLRRARDTVRLPVTDVNGGLDSGESWAEQIFGNRPHQQHDWIRTREHSPIDTEAEPCSHAKNASERNHTLIQNRTPGSEVCRRNAFENVQLRDDQSPSLRKVDDPIVQAKRRVWDILNCGSLHRFTCEGLIVSNCLWLDFSDTTDRLGPVDSIKGRKKRDKKEDGAAPQKLCEFCGEVVRPASLMKCPSCGATLRELEEQQAVAVSNAPVMAHQVQPVIVYYPVSRVAYSIHQKEGKPDSLRVDYYSGLRRVGSEWVCFEHQGFARAKAEQWWNERQGPAYYGVPDLTTEAKIIIKQHEEEQEGLDPFDQQVWKSPTAIRVNETGKYPEIIGYQWPEQETTA